jgi:peptidoglycan L-alanyl-D-glutamate endopeptidase CwlK
MERLLTCKQPLVLLFSTVVVYRDCTIICGRRGKEEQDSAFASGASKNPWPTSNHNALPPALSKAVDCGPYINGKVSMDSRECLAFGGFVMGVASMIGLGGKIRWGGDWDRDGSVTDQFFNDLLHFELIGG